VKHRSKWFVLLLFVLGCSAGFPARAQEKNTTPLIANSLQGPLLEVHFLDAGQGDAIYVRTPGGKHYMVDTGTRSSRRTVVPYLKYLKVDKLTGVLITHGHADHIGGLYYIAGEIPVETLLYSGHIHPGKHNAKTIKLLDEQGTKKKALRRGDKVELDEGVTMEVFSPPKEWNLDVEDANNGSVVVKLTYGEIDFILTGDAEKHAEREMVKQKLALKSEFLKVGHHGSKTATTLPFLELVDPLYAVISCGQNNKFKHPHAETLEALKKQGATILRTDQNGTIGVYTNGKRIMIKIKGKSVEPVSVLVKPSGSGVPGFVLVNRAGLIFINRGGIHAC
jgi:competence protein ComEC